MRDGSVRAAGNVGEPRAQRPERPCLSTARAPTSLGAFFSSARLPALVRGFTIFVCGSAACTIASSSQRRRETVGAEGPFYICPACPSDAICT